MNEALQEAFRRTDYLVCLSPLEWLRIRIDQTLPANLQVIVGDQSWAFITAWNPDAQQRPDGQNELAQRGLLDALSGRPELVVHAAIGIGSGSDPWYEPSLFVIGPELALFDALARKYRQKGFVHGCGAGTARLRFFDP